MDYRNNSTRYNLAYRVQNSLDFFSGWLDPECLDYWRFGILAENTILGIPRKTMGGWQKGGTSPQKRWQKGGHCFSSTASFFYVHVVVGINPTAQQDVCASKVHHSSHVHRHCIRTAKRPTACSASTIVSKKSNVRTGNISDLRTVGVCFIQEEPQNISCILNRGRIQQQ